ncbi:MAG: tRNA lysidine(34) synthetase TilS [Paracoccaceae bacterium]|nr:tRNA lysidine(34) synthetase TilS [Paracoccaceae bacterium]MDG2258921.1 tRNA lysidine(34) synthetase TilS [Paracoccaceae bacterium]
MTPKHDLALGSFEGLGCDVSGKLGLAVSGGGDSLALLHLAVDWASQQSAKVFVYTVDHGLRPEAATEAAFVGDLCRQLGVTHKVLNWTGWDGAGNLPQEARRARYRLIAEAANEDGVKTIALGHTQDDQAETFLMALTRRSGVDGLAGMPRCKADHGVNWIRPLLDVSRSTLRSYLTEADQKWIEDPTNEDTAYERVRMRNAKDELGMLGLSADAMSAVAQNMQSVQSALREVTQSAKRDICTPISGAVRLNRKLFLAQPEEIKRRLVVDCLRYVAPNAAAPRREALKPLLIDPDAKDASLSGCLVLFKPDAIWIVREPNAVKALESEVEAHWDGKWRVKGPLSEHNLVIRALGEEGLKCFPDWRDAGLPRPAMLASPSIWQGERLIAAPLVAQSADWSAEMLFGAENFFLAP